MSTSVRSPIASLVSSIIALAALGVQPAEARVSINATAPTGSAIDGNSVVRTGELSEVVVTATKLGAADVHIEFTLKGSGRHATRFWTCDFTEDYIRINASYRT